MKVVELNQNKQRVVDHLKHMLKIVEENPHLTDAYVITILMNETNERTSPTTSVTTFMHDHFYELPRISTGVMALERSKMKLMDVDE